MQKPLEEIVDTHIFSDDFLTRLRKGYGRKTPTQKNKFPIGWKLIRIDRDPEYALPTGDNYVICLLPIQEWWGFTERDITFAAELAKQGHSEDTIATLLGYSKVYCDEAYDVITTLGRIIPPQYEKFPDLVRGLLMFQVETIYKEDPQLKFMCEPGITIDEALRRRFTFVAEKGGYIVGLGSPQIFALFHRNNAILEILGTWLQEYDFDIIAPSLDILIHSQEEFLQFYFGLQNEEGFRRLNPDSDSDVISTLSDAWPLTVQQQNRVKTVLASSDWRPLSTPEHFSRVLTIIKNADKEYTVAEMQELLDNSPPDILALRRIGQGAFKRTYLAFDEVLEERVALKVFNPADEHQQPHLRRLLYADADYRHYTGPERRQRAMEREFKEEAQALRKVNHPNLAKFLGVGLRPKMYLVEEYIEGRTLLEIALNPKTRAKKRYTEQVCAHINQVVLALNYLHDQFSLCHLDPKPSNIILPDLILGEMVPLHCRGVCVLTDLGSSQRVEPGEEIKLHKPISRIFQAPEIIERGMVAHGTDYWMLGITAYMVLFGHHPFYPSLTLEAWERLPVGSDEREELARKVEENVRVVMQSKDMYPKGMIYAPGQYPRIKHTLDAFPRDVGESACSFNPHLFSESVLVSSISDKNTEQEGLGSTPALFLYNLFVNILTQPSPFRYIINRR